jgi:LysM domain.
MRAKKINLTMITVLILIVLLGVITTSFLSQAKTIGKAENQKSKYYTSIQIQEGDSLWSIADKYISSEYETIQYYIEEVKSINHLTDEHINEGLFLTIPYYSYAIK